VLFKILFWKEKAADKFLCLITLLSTPLDIEVPTVQHACGKISKLRMVKINVSRIAGL
jgi:hypothetical protein